MIQRTKLAVCSGTFPSQISKMKSALMRIGVAKNTIKKNENFEALKTNFKNVPSFSAEYSFVICGENAV